jgi:hypothetical protein
MIQARMLESSQSQATVPATVAVGRVRDMTGWKVVESPQPRPRENLRLRLWRAGGQSSYCT